MSASMILVVGGLTAVGTYLATSRVLSRIVVGFALLGHAAVLALITAGGPAGDPPLADRTDPADSSNPLPQALSLTAIVISFGLTLFLLALARRQHTVSGNDLVEDDIEDRRIASLRALHPDLDLEIPAERSSPRGSESGRAASDRSASPDGGADARSDGGAT